MFQTWLDDTKHWAARPYKPEGSVLDWFLFFGLVAICAFSWTRIIERIIK